MTRRRSKVRSKTRSDSSQKSEDEILYCICRSSDGTRFMIACDNCEEWYHGDCINVTPKQANNIKRFFCHLCIGRNPSLEIEYKTTKENRPRLPNLRQQIKKINFSSDEENDADLSSSSSPDKSLASTKSKRATRKRWRPSISESVGKKRRGRPKERQDEYDDEATEDEIETSGFAHSMGDCVDDGTESAYIGQGYRGIGNADRIVSKRGPIDRVQLSNKASNRSIITNNYHPDPTKWCGVCVPCKRTTDCGQCDNCRRYGSRDICRKRWCIRTEYRNQSMKSYHTPKEYGTLIDDDLDGVLDDPDYHNQHMRRRGGGVAGSGDFAMSDARQRLSNPPVTNKDTCTIGSKMRRGDHLPGGGNSSSHRRSLTNAGGGGVPYKCQVGVGGGEDEDSLDMINGSASFRYHQSAPNNRLSKHQPSQQQPTRRARNQSNTATQMSSNTSSISGGQMSSQQYQYAEDSEEDVMIPGEILSPTNGQRIDDPDARHLSTYQQQRSTKSTLNSDVKYHYGLNYPDHLYCKHHRSYDWHCNLVGGDLSSSSEVVVMVTGPNSNTQTCSGGGGNSIIKSEKDLDMVHSRLRSPSLDQQLSPSNFMVLDRSSTKTSAMATNIRLPSSSSLSSSDHLRYSKMKNATSASSSSAASSSIATTQGVVVASLPALSSSLVIDRHEAVVMPGIVGPGGADNFSQSSYHHHNLHHQIVDLNQPMTATEITLHKSSSSQLLPVHSTINNTTITTNNNNNNNNSSNNNQKEPLPHSISVFMKSSLANTQQQHQQQQQQISQEFYTINDEDDLEINWPKETVNA